MKRLRASFLCEKIPLLTYKHSFSMAYLLLCHVYDNLNSDVQNENTNDRPSLFFQLNLC